MSLYVATGAFGYLAFGDSVAQDVLQNFPDSDLAADAAKVLMVLHIVLAAPVILFPGARCVAFFMRRRGADRRLAAAVARCLGGCPCLLAAALSPVAARAATAGPMLALCALLAVFVPQVAVLFALVGATVSTAEIYLFPAAMILNALREGGDGGGDVCPRAEEAAAAGVGARAPSASFGRPLLVEDYNTPLSEIISPATAEMGPWDTWLLAHIMSRRTAVTLLVVGSLIAVLGT